MATWNMQQYDAAVNDAQRTLDNQYRRQQAEFLQDYKRSEQQRLIDNEMNRRKVAAEQLKYDRNRQAILDQRAKQDYDLNYGARLRADELAKLEQQNKIDAQRNAVLQKDYYSRTYTPYQEALLKLKANGGNINALSDVEKDAIQQEIGYMIDEEAGQQFVSDVRNATPEYLKEQGVNPGFVPLYAREQRATAARNAEYERKNAPAIAKAQQQMKYDTVEAYITKELNKHIQKGNIPKNINAANTIKAATNYYIAARSSGQNISFEDALKEAAGIKDKLPTISEQAKNLYGTQYNDLGDKDKEKLEAMLTKFSKLKQDFEDAKYSKGSIEELNALRELEEQWRQMANISGFGNWLDTYSDVKSPIFDRLQHADYAVNFQDLQEREKSLSEKYPRYFKWAKDNPNIAIRNYAKYLVAPEEYEETTMNMSVPNDSSPTPMRINIPVKTKKVPQYFQDFQNEMFKLQQLRNHLVELEKRINANKNRYTD